MLRRLYDWTMDLAGHRHAIWILGAISFIESSIFPIPPDVLLIPLVLAAPTRAWRIALVCTLASVLGGLLGYAIGALLYDSIGLPVLAFYGYEQKFDVFAAYYNEWGAWAVFIAGLTPFPYKVITILSGVTQLDLSTFMLASVLARGLRFFIVAALLWKFGAPIRVLIEKHMGLLATLFVALLLGGFLALKYL